MIVSECILDSDHYGRQLARSLGIVHEVKKDGFRMYNEIIKHYDAVSIAQLSIGFGKQALPQYCQYVAPSPIPMEIHEGNCDSVLKIFEGLMFPPPRELTTEEVVYALRQFKKHLFFNRKGIRKFK